MKKSRLLLLPLLFFLVSCGPIMGQMTRLGDGIKSFRVVSGSLASLKKGSNLLVVGPFAKGEGAYYIARGDDAAFFYSEFDRNGFVKPELYVGDKYQDPDEAASALRSLNGAELKNKLGLKAAPDFILFGKITERSTFVAPTRGILQRIGYRLEFVNTANGSSTVVEAVVRSHFSKCTEIIVDELVRRAQS